MIRANVWVATLISCSLLATGCSEYQGVISASAANPTPVDYTPKANPDAHVVDVTTIDPWAAAEPPLALPEGLNWEKSKPIAFAGEVKTPDERTTGTVIAVVISPVLANGDRGEPTSNQVTARCQRGDKFIPYRIDWYAPKTPGRYHVAIKSVGPSVDLANLDTFVEGVVEVR